MKTSYYPKLAFEGIKKNKKMYFPYILTCILSVSMFYIIKYLCVSKTIKQIPKTEAIIEVLTFGSAAIAVFSVVFLFYTNSFLIKSRKKEFGLYNVLGMDKNKLGRILVLETLIIAVISIVLGIIFGVVFSKLSELILLKLIGTKINFSLSISLKAIWQTALLFLCIFAVVLLNSLRQVRFASPLDLVKGGNVGEKPPKANYLFGIFGFVLIGGAYVWALRVKSPINALLWFFVAVVAVIIGTYLCMISGSVMLCKILQKNKKYYYKKNHFISVSSMSFRMKRNGAGLASICVLLTMALVMISSTSCLYFGSEESLKARYPRDILVNCKYNDISLLTEENNAVFRNKIEKVCKENNISQKDIWDYGDSSISGLLAKKNHIEIDPRNTQSRDYENLVTVHFISLDDYNKMMGKNETLKPFEALAFATLKYKVPKALNIGGCEIKVKESIKKLDIGDMTAEGVINLYIIAENSGEIAQTITSKNDLSDEYGFENQYFYAFNSKSSAKEKEKVSSLIGNAVFNEISTKKTAFGYSVNCLETARIDFKGTFGGFLFLGVMLSILFIVVAVIIIYYKQVSEGLEDANRFDIMQKVGMTKKDIKKSVNSQMLIVFFLPIGFAMLHLCFAFSIIRKLLLLFGLNNLSLLLITTAVSVIAFALFYLLVYRLSSNVYFSIVSVKKE